MWRMASSVGPNSGGEPVKLLAQDGNRVHLHSVIFNFCIFNFEMTSVHMCKCI